jgi:GNAT superfamily N-acetyltransferase
VGILYGRFYPNGLAHLEDVEVTDGLLLEQTWLDFLLRRTRTRCYRGRGIGSKLLREFLQICQSRNVRAIAGWVVQKDATEKLLDWYERNGFEKQTLDEDSFPELSRPPSAVWTIVWKSDIY